jgi:hypothetical protein
VELSLWDRRGTANILLLPKKRCSPYCSGIARVESGGAGDSTTLTVHDCFLSPCSGARSRDLYEVGVEVANHWLVGGRRLLVEHESSASDHVFYSL